jgi:6-phosphogluconolactonase (cycloisomerase 2 family)
MKFSKPGQILLATAVSAIVGLGLTSCGQSNTIDFLYVTANKNATGQISVYWVDQESGAISQIPDSPYPSGGQNPVAEVATPNGKNLFVVNRDDNTIVDFAIGTDAKLYPQKTCNTPGTEPISIAVNTAGTQLYVVDTYAPAPNGQAAYSETNPGPGALVEFPLDSSQQFSSCTPVANGSQSYWPLGNYPGGVAVAANDSYVYVVNTGSIVTTTTPPTAGVPVVAPTSGAGTISGFSIGSNGALTALSGSPFEAGTAPLGIAIDPTSRFLYATDAAQNQIIEYSIQNGGVLVPLNPGTTATQTFPVGITVDPRDMFVYVTNYTSGSISSYNINQANGALSSNATPTLPTGPGSTCVTIEPALDRFVFTSNFLQNEVSSAELNTNTGSLTTDQNSPYPSAAQPTCVVAVPHGNHSQQTVTVIPTGNN